MQDIPRMFSKVKKQSVEGATGDRSPKKGRKMFGFRRKLYMSGCIAINSAKVHVSQFLFLSVVPLIAASTFGQCKLETWRSINTFQLDKNYDKINNIKFKFQFVDR